MARPYWSRQVQILARVVHVACRIFWASSECDSSPEAVCGEVGARRCPRSRRASRTGEVRRGLGKTALSLHSWSPALNDPDKQYDQRQDKQDVDESAQRVRTDDAEQPKHQQDYKYCPKHKGSPCRYRRSRTVYCRASGLWLAACTRFASRSRSSLYAMLAHPCCQRGASVRLRTARLTAGTCPEGRLSCVPKHAKLQAPP